LSEGGAVTGVGKVKFAQADRSVHPNLRASPGDESAGHRVSS
jgi:hypothetical protein